MTQVIGRETPTVCLEMGQRRNRELLIELLSDYHLVEVEEAVAEDTDLCVVDEGGYERSRDALEAWKADQEPVYAPVLLLADADRGNAWSRYADELGDTVDSILEVPQARSAVRSRIASLLETRRYARELAGEQELIGRIFQTSPVAKTLLDTDGTIVRANQAAEELFGLRASEIEGQPYDAPAWQLADADGDPIPDGQLLFEQVLAGGEPIHGEELVVTRPDGETVCLSVNMAPLRDRTDEIEYLVTVMEDVTEERRLARELQASEELHRTTLENITDTVVLTDDEGEFTYVCPNTAHIFGMTTAEVEALGDITALLGTDPAPTDLDEIGLVENRELTITDTEGEAHVVLVTVKSVSIQEGSRLYSVRDITRRAAVEDELQETLDSRSFALEAAEAGIWEWDVHDDTLTWDESLEAITGIDPEGSWGLETALEELFHPDDLARVQATIERTLTSHEPDGVTARVRPESGGPTWLDIRGRPEVGDDGEVTRLLGVAIDVTERVERERELARYQKIVETAADPIYALDSGGTITLANEAFATAVGGTRAEVVGTNITDHLDPSDVEASLEHIADLVAGEDPGVLELTLDTADGERRYEVNVSLHGGFEGEDVPGTVGVARDVTDLREGERLLRRAQRAVDASGHAIYITDHDGTIVYANPAFERVTGFTPEEAVGRDPSILNAGVKDRDYYDELWGTISNGDLWEEEIVNERKDGERYHADQTIAPITDEDGRIEGYVGIQTDITEHKDRLQQLQVMDRVLRHNLHNALNVVLGHAELIQETGTGSTSRGDVSAILKKGHELLELADKQREITKVLSSEPTSVELDLVPVIERIVDDLCNRYPSASVELDLPDECRVIASEGISRTLRELVQNAIEHADSGAPSVAVSIERTSEGVAVRVADRGPGIPAVERDIVTGQQSVDQLFHGSGLGLWLVAWLVRRSDGTLQFEENEPRGSTVTITLNPAD